MIFVTVGSSSIPFDRLLRAFDGVHVDERLVVQHGASTIRPRHAECVAFLSYKEFVELMENARVVVTHAGVGSIMTALAARKRPMVVPRLGSLDEAVDDHQVPFARRACELGLVTLVENVDLLASAIADYEPRRQMPPSGRSPIEVALRSYVEECLGTETQSVMTKRSTA